MVQREHWSGRLGFVMAAAGSAIGLGNIWRFPYVTGENGGGAFLIIYLAIILLFGVSMLIAEILIGRTGQRNPISTFSHLGGPLWAVVGLIGVLTGFIILSFYVVVAGWTLAYTGFAARGLLDSTDPATLAERFTDFTGDPIAPLIYAALFMLLVGLTVGPGVRKGIERSNLVLMPLFFVLLLVLLVFALRLPGAMDGVRFFLTPDFSAVTAGTFSAALAQAFFSLSLGMGCMLTYGSYLKRDENIPSAAVTITGMDLVASIMCGLLVLPVVFAFGFDPGSGPGLTFITLPAAFAAMPMGGLVGLLFFFLLAIAALTSALSILEPAVSYLIERRGWSRAATVAGCAVVALLFAVPASLSFGLLDNVNLLGRNWFDLMDFLATSVLMPLGALLMAVFIGWFWAKPALAALSNDGRLRQPWAGAWLFVLRFIAPIGLAWILLLGMGIVTSS